MAAERNTLPVPPKRRGFVLEEWLQANVDTLSAWIEADLDRRIRDRCQMWHAQRRTLREVLAAMKRRGFAAEKWLQAKIDALGEEIEEELEEGSMFFWERLHEQRRTLREVLAAVTSGVSGAASPRRSAEGSGSGRGGGRR